MVFKEYLSSIIYISFFAIILELFLPKTKLKKYITSIISLLIILSIISPLFDVLNNQDVEKAIDNAIYAISSNSKQNTENNINFNKYKNTIIVSRVKSSLETEMLSEFSNKLQNIAKVSKVEIELNEEYKIEEVIVYIESGNLDTAKIILDTIISEYNIPSSMLKIKEKRN